MIREAVRPDGIAADAGRQKRAHEGADKENPENRVKGRQVAPFERAEQDEPAIRHDRAVEDDQHRRDKERQESGPLDHVPDFARVRAPEGVTEQRQRKRQAEDAPKRRFFHRTLGNVSRWRAGSCFTR